MKHAVRLAVLAALLLMLAACSAADDAVTGNGGTDVNEQNGGSEKGGGGEGADGAGTGPDGAESTEGAFYEVLATNLRSPWSIAFDRGLRKFDAAGYAGPENYARDAAAAASEPSGSDRSDDDVPWD